MRNPQQQGYSLIELVIYIALFALISVVIMNALVTVMRTYASAQGYRRLQTNGELIMERVVREVRDASTVAGGSVYGAHPGTLSLSGTDTGGAPRTAVFSVINGALVLSENGTSANLSTSEVTVNTFIVRHITTTNGEGVRIELGLTTTNGHIVSAPFYATAMLRGM
jgi:Tfp pilus assembly protein PilW